MAMKTSGSSRSAAPGRKKKRTTSAGKSLSPSGLDRLHQSGKDMTAYLDLSKARRPGREVQRVNVDFPQELLQAIDAAARRIGVSRQAFIKIRLADLLDKNG